MTEREHPSSREPRTSYGRTVLAGLAGAALAAVAGTNDWARATGDAAGIKVQAVAKGSEAAPLVTALALVSLAAWGVVLVSRGRVRRVVSVVGAAAALGVLAAVVAAFDGARTVALDALTGKGAGGHTATVTLSAWYYTAGVGALLTLVSFAVAVVVAPSWPAMGNKYDAPGSRADLPPTEQDMWRALDQGHDPTS